MKIGLVVLLWLVLAIIGVLTEVSMFNECRDHGFSVFYCINKV